MGAAMVMICTICARGGSKGVPGKNIRPIAGKPLIAWTIGQAKASGLFDMVAVSSDSADILAVAKAAGADHLVPRPAEMATDQAGKVPAIAHCLLSAEAALGAQSPVFVDLDATSPLRDIDDIRGAVALIRDSGATNVITAMPSRRSPYFNMVEPRADGSVGLSKPLPDLVLRRQDSPRVYDMNGSIYVWRRDPFLAHPAVFYDDTRLWVMPEERSIDIDSPVDFDLVELLLTRKYGG